MCEKFKRQARRPGEGLRFHSWVCLRLESEFREWPYKYGVYTSGLPYPGEP